jgi:hypothetical protein
VVDAVARKAPVGQQLRQVPVSGAASRGGTYGRCRIVGSAVGRALLRQVGEQFDHVTHSNATTRDARPVPRQPLDTHRYLCA